jgi:eukaryotic-like serine/threonine-protein kinase
MKCLKTVTIIYLLMISTLLFSIHSFGMDKSNSKQVLWSFDTEGPVRSTPVIVGETLFIGSDSGFLYALNKRSGTLKWKFKADSAIASDPQPSETQLFFTTKKGSIYALNTNTGEKIWSFSTKAETLYEGGWDYFISSPVIWGKYIIKGSGDNHIYALHKKNGSIAWKYNSAAIVRSTPIVDKKRVFCGTMAGEIIALSLKRGKLIWKFKAKGSKYFPKGEFLFKPLLSNNIIFAGSRDASFYAIDADKGTQIWKVSDAKGAWYTNAIAANETVFAASSDGQYIHALEPISGKEKWKFFADDLIFSTPLVKEKKLYFGSHDNYIYAVNALSGKQLWRFKTGDDVLGSPTINDDILYIGSDDGKLYCFDLKSIYSQSMNNMSHDKETFHAIYYAPTLDKKIAHINSPLPFQIYEKFRDLGYSKLDDQGLIRYIRKRLEQKQVSSTRIVLASYAYPYSILETKEKDPSLLKQYLDNGGTIVWIGDLPQLLFTIKKDTPKPITAGKEAMAALGFDREFLSKSCFFYDAYISHPTEAGKKLGLPSWWSSGYGVDPKKVSTVLGLNEHGKATAWIKNYGGPANTGLIRISILPEYN